MEYYVLRRELEDVSRRVIFVLFYANEDTVSFLNDMKTIGRVFSMIFL